MYKRGEPLSGHPIRAGQRPASPWKAGSGHCVRRRPPAAVGHRPARGGGNSSQPGRRRMGAPAAAYRGGQRPGRQRPATARPRCRDGKWAYINHISLSEITIVNVATHRVVGKSDRVDVIDTATNKVTGTLAIGQEPQALVYVPTRSPPARPTPARPTWAPREWASRATTCRPPCPTAARARPPCSPARASRSRWPAALTMSLLDRRGVRGLTPPGL
jgi:YVTN family beta-propeller protein